MAPKDQDRASLCSDSPCIIDAPALIAYLQGTSKGEVVQRLMEHAHTCGAKMKTTALDMIAVFLKGMTEHGDSFPELLALLDQLPVRMEPITEEAALEAARIMAEYRGLGVGAGLCIYLARTEGGTLITGDAAVYHSSLLPKDRMVYAGNDDPQV
ncbi:MAG: PIN domain-containing protein [Bacillota bacterium]|jgi:predicted nucleic acid-binding protein|nr:type II toxin-antitoxin system VapC family toxin [Candidatus Fermentithermobacillaceae bacterium]